MQTIGRREFVAGGFAIFPFFRGNDRKLAGIRMHRIRGTEDSGRRFLLIHGNEQTAREVLTGYMERARGVAWLVRNNTRNVTIEDGELDPNRMFSLEGALRNLRSLNEAWPDERVLDALDFLHRKRREFVQAVLPRRGNLLIAVHNNGPGYSVNDETPISDRVSLKDAANPREFCLCTDPTDFERLAAGPYNAVLQNTAPKDDDGSLSRLAARTPFRYVNIEAAHGQAEKQRAMLGWVDQNL